MEDLILINMQYFPIVYLKVLHSAFHHLFHYTCLFFSNLINLCATLHNGLSTDTYPSFTSS